MRTYHFETRPQADRRPRAFTLTELLVVITIIAILAALITGAAMAALRRAQEARITLEINEMSQAVEDFKNEYGAYPPNGMTNGVNSAGDSVGVLIRSDFERMFKKAFSSGREPFDLLRGLVGDTSAPSLNSDQMLPGGMRADEALFFWLGGFSSDPRFPISGPGGPSFDRDINREVLEDRNRRFEFDLGRIGPRDKTTGGFPASSNRFIEYDVDLNGDNDFNDAGEHRRINFWVYSPANSELPYVYFDTSRHDPDDYDLNAYSPGETATSPQVFAVKKLREGVSVAVDLRDIIFVNKDRFQILHAGIDDAWGDFRVFSIGDGSNFSNVMHYPTGPFIGDVADTLANFAQGNFASEQE